MKLDRLLGILTVLLRKNSVTAPELAARFEVSRRTISRDIDALCRAGIPVITRQGGKGGISIAEGYRLDKSVLTKEELGSILAGLKGIGSVTERSHLLQMLDKLGAGTETVMSLREPVVIDLASYYKGDLTLKIRQIKEAIWGLRQIAFVYYYEKGESHRRLEPYYVVFQWGAWYVYGFCPQRQDWRLFKLTRLWNLEITDKPFALREIPPEKQDLHASLPDDKRLVALCDPGIKYQIIDTYGPNCYTETESGKLRLEIGYTNPGHILSWLLGFGGSVQVLEPPEIAAAIQKEAEKILGVYNT